MGSRKKKNTGALTTKTSAACSQELRSFWEMVCIKLTKYKATKMSGLHAANE